MHGESFEESLAKEIADLVRAHVAAVVQGRCMTGSRSLSNRSRTSNTAAFGTTARATGGIIFARMTEASGSVCAIPQQSRVKARTGNCGPKRPRRQDAKSQPHERATAR